VGEFDILVKEFNLKTLFFKEHPLSGHYRGSQDSRDWMFDVQGYFPSFFSFWKKCKKQLKY
jgi:deoxyribodipyrimidine photo-lyase